MTRYFFDLHDDMDVSDAEGKELVDLGAATAYAIKLTRDMVAASATEHGKIDLGHCVDVRDCDGEVVEIKFGDAVRFVRAGQLV
jgi:hypothetical protein